MPMEEIWEQREMLVQISEAQARLRTDAEAARLFGEAARLAEADDEAARFSDDEAARFTGPAQLAEAARHD